MHGGSLLSRPTNDLDQSFAVEHASSIKAAVRAVRRSEPAIVICDVTLEDESPIDVFRALQPELPKVPFVVTCDRCRESDRVGGLQIGIDDYLCSPLSKLEAHERLRALLRRSRHSVASRSPGYAGDHLMADFEGIEVRVDDRSVDLTRREFDLLRFLVENRNRVVTRDELLEHVWRSVPVNDRRTVDTHIRKLRTKLGAVGRQIQTSFGRGYRFVPALLAATQLLLATT